MKPNSVLLGSTRPPKGEGRISLVGSFQVESGRVISDRVGSGHFRSDRLGSFQVESDRVISSQIGSGHFRLSWVISSQIGSGQVRSFSVKQCLIVISFTLTLNDIAEEGLQGKAERPRTRDLVDLTRFAQRRFDDVSVIVVELNDKGENADIIVRCPSRSSIQ